MDVLELTSESPEQTAELGARLADLLEPGVVVGLVGDLGAGKTHLVRAIVTALGVDAEEVGSPTFVLVREYRGRVTVFHFDAYRLADEDEFLELGADEMLHGEGVCLVEWADRVASCLPPDTLWIEIAHAGEEDRRIRLHGIGDHAERIARSLGE